MLEVLLTDAALDFLRVESGDGDDFVAALLSGQQGGRLLRDPHHLGDESEDFGVRPILEGGRGHFEFPSVAVFTVPSGFASVGDGSDFDTTRTLRMRVCHGGRGSWLDLGFDVDADEGARAGLFGDEIADEPSASPELDVARAFSAVNEDRTFWSAVRVVVGDADAFKAVESLEFVACFFGVPSLGVRIDEIGVEERVFDVAPAAVGAVSAGAGGSDLRGFNHAFVVPVLT